LVELYSRSCILAAPGNVLDLTNSEYDNRFLYGLNLTVFYNICGEVKAKRTDNFRERFLKVMQVDEHGLTSHKYEPYKYDKIEEAIAMAIEPCARVKPPQAATASASVPQSQEGTPSASLPPPPTTTAGGETPSHKRKEPEGAAEPTSTT